MKIYCASKFENTKQVREAFELLKKDGHEITHDWTNESAEGKTGDELNEYLSACAINDFSGAAYCDAMLVIYYPDAPMRGAYVEMGIAIGRNIPVIVVTNEPKRANIFYSLPGVWLTPTIEKGIKMLKQLEE